MRGLGDADDHPREPQRLASILFDKRGTGLSDRVRGIAPLEDRIDDVRALMEAVGSERAALLETPKAGR